MTDTVDQQKSILYSIEKLLGIMPEVTVFETDIIIHINTVFSILTQMGVGPKNGFAISSANNTWDEFMSEESNPILLNDVKTYVYMKVKMIFDPPSSSPLIDSYNNTIKELEYRLYTHSGGY